MNTNVPERCQCGGYLLQLSPGFFHCFNPDCDVYLHRVSGRTRPYALGTIPKSIQEIQMVSPAESGGELTTQMVAYIRRIAERLAPLTGLDEDGKRRALRVQNQFRGELSSALTNEDPQEFRDWLDRTKTLLGYHSSKFYGALIDAAEGLTDPDVLSLKETFTQMLMATQGMAGMIKK